MPLARYFVFVGGVLLALLFLINEMLPQFPEAERAEASANKSTIRIHSDRKWPERVVFDTSVPTIVPVQTAMAEASVPVLAPTTVADVSAKPRSLEAFAQLKPSEPKKPDLKPQHKRKVAKTHAAPRMILVAQQPRYGFFDNGNW